MPRKPKFRPKITRVKLNPEQAVLQCSCYDIGVHIGPIGNWNPAGAACCLDTTNGWKLKINSFDVVASSPSS